MKNVGFTDFWGRTMRNIKAVEKLTDQQTALLMAKLTVPVAVSEILLEGRKLAEDECLALHQILSDMEPDTAFLAMSMAIAELGYFQGIRKTPLMGTLTLQARQYVSEYAPLWLENAQSTTHVMDERNVYDLLCTLPEDLEALNEMIVIVLSSSAVDETARQILRVFQIQSNAHRIIAETLLEEFENLGGCHDMLPSFDEIEQAYQANALNKEQNQNNIIAFPARN